MKDFHCVSASGDCDGIALVLDANRPFDSLGLEGCVIKNYREATKADADGVVFLFVLNRKTTPASRSQRLRDILLIARPPLLAVMQGGEYASPKLLDIFSAAP